MVTNWDLLVLLTKYLEDETNEEKKGSFLKGLEDRKIVLQPGKAGKAGKVFESSDGEFFNSDGTFKVPLSYVFDGNGNISYEILEEATKHIEINPISPAAHLYWAVKMADTTHGNYCARTLYYRSQD